jgi:hypothetical protein
MAIVLSDVLVARRPYTAARSVRRRTGSFTGSYVERIEVIEPDLVRRLN